MNEKIRRLSPHYKPVQIAYFVNDIRAAAKMMADTLGAGPFYVIDHIELEWGIHRGQACQFLHSSAYGQWGDVMMELIQQDEEGPSPFRDMFAPGQEGLHHTACFVDSLDETLDQYAQQGYPTAARAMAKLGTEFAFIDTTPLMGHMIEVYVADETLLGFYDSVKTASHNWMGDDAVRTIG